MARQLANPPAEYVQAVIEGAILPMITELEKELGTLLPTLVTIRADSIAGPTELIAATADQQPAGEMRLSFKETFIPGRLLFFAESLYAESAARGTGFSGFDIRGEVVRSGSGLEVRKVFATVKNNVRHWRGWR